MRRTITRRPGRVGVVARAALLAVVAAVAVSSCSDGTDDVRSVASAGWSSYGGNAANSNFAYPTSPDELALSWTRPTGGPISAPITISSRYNVGVTSRTAAGCNTFVLDSRAGRKNFCRRLGVGAELNSMLVDQFENIYIGEAGQFYALNGGGAVRWKFATVGVPVSAKFAAKGVVLMVTNQGQILLLNAQTGEPVAPGIALRPNADPAQPAFGLGDCVTAGPNCPVPASPAVDDEREQFYLNYFPENAIASEVRAMRYDEVKGARSIRQSWATQIPSGVIGTPTLSADRKTLYVFDRLGSIYALDAETGKRKWDYFIGGYGFGTMSVSPDGTIIPTGVIGSPLITIRDRGDRAEAGWRRNDLQTVSLATSTEAKTAWVVVRDPNTKALKLLEVSATDGSTKRSLDLPQAVGFTTGVAVSPGGDVATATNLGEVYYFAPPKT
ncbi:outer membrane protein assembly factor BamB family protein [Williamsia phyllosphaerae]|uniref:outer membrane protein assembly factor BamB family protein n=1 Tax=Williamsia phyllosphaerae TaxID=885042 RepID=UPI001669342F|nr:PQQ-binding-like beta-propeller repeat protein [Williamsia phyllosphaerae]